MYPSEQVDVDLQNSADIQDDLKTFKNLGFAPVTFRCVTKPTGFSPIVLGKYMKVYTYTKHLKKRNMLQH